MKFSKFGLGAIVCVSAALLAPATVLAGYKYPAGSLPVTIGFGWAYGSLGDVANSSDNVQYIGCTTLAAGGWCVAQNSVGNSVSCFTTDPQLLATMRSISGDSFVYIQWSNNPSGATCIQIEVDNYSYFVPKRL